MDNVETAWYTMLFRLAYLEKQGTEFQDWFVKLAGSAYGADFEEVRPYGNVGDWKCDGWRVSTGAVFQCYAPKTLKPPAFLKKIDEDFGGAVTYWPPMKAWHLVHNENQGLPPQIAGHFNSLRLAHPNLIIGPWSEPELLALLPLLSKHHLIALFGPVPTTAVVEKLNYSDLSPVVDAIAQADPDVALEPKAPSLDKLEHNKLSPDTAELLRVGRRKEQLVAEFIDKRIKPDTGERIAQTFRDRYAELKALDLMPDAIFMHLHKLVGTGGSPRHMAAGLAILSYFFERCDIFEDVPEAV